ATERGIKLNANYGRSLAGIGEEHRFLDADEMRELTGSTYYLGGLFTPGAVMIQPADYIRGFAAGLSPKVDIFEHSPVLKLERHGGTWKAVLRRGAVT
ncbi:MAG: FAD-binding oxidoreductase, partial [Mesorhizobium sp.]